LELGNLLWLEATQRSPPGGEKDSILRSRQILLADATLFPMQSRFVAFEDLLSLSHGSANVFKDLRSRAIIEELVRDHGLVLVAFLGRIGEFLYATLARYAIMQATECGDGLSPAAEISARSRLVPLNVFVEVLEVPDDMKHHSAV
jgi:hypothetical protein